MRIFEPREQLGPIPIEKAEAHMLHKGIHTYLVQYRTPSEMGVRYNGRDIIVAASSMPELDAR